MPIYDYECQACGQISEAVRAIDEQSLPCPVCQVGQAHRIISCGNSAYLGNQDAPWLKTVGEVVGNETIEGRVFLNNPTRDNLRRWMRAKGLRPLEPGEKPGRPAPVDTTRITEQLVARHRKRMALAVGGI